MTGCFCRQRNRSMLHKHSESTAPVVAIATGYQPLQAMNASGPNQQAPMINKVSALALEQHPNTYVLLATAIVAVQGQTQPPTRRNIRSTQLIRDSDQAHSSSTI